MNQTLTVMPLDNTYIPTQGLKGLFLEGMLSDLKYPPVLIKHPNDVKLYTFKKN
jgi:hypothetical protein